MCVCVYCVLLPKSPVTEMSITKVSVIKMSITKMSFTKMSWIHIKHILYNTNIFLLHY